MTKGDRYIFFLYQSPSVEKGLFYARITVRGVIFSLLTHGVDIPAWACAKNWNPPALIRVEFDGFLSSLIGKIVTQHTHSREGCVRGGGSDREKEREREVAAMIVWGIAESCRQRRHSRQD